VDLCGKQGSWAGRKVVLFCTYANALHAHVHAFLDACTAVCCCMHSTHRSPG
jgi:hypothetical protein